MFYDPTIVQIAGHSFGLVAIVEGAAAILFALLIGVLILAWRAQSGRKAEATRTAELEYRLAELSGMLGQFSTQSQTAQSQLQQALNERLDAVGHRVGQGLAEGQARTMEQLGELHERLAVIDAAQGNLTTLSQEMLSLKDILANKQTRGAFGQARMEAIVMDGLPARAYSFQAKLSNETRPDCLITLPDSKLKLVIDAKFPLEAYNALKSAESDEGRKAAETQLKSDILKHVKDISEKYLIGGETHETAIMFIPSESIYLELNEHYEDLVQRAHKSRVIMASPNVLMLLVQTMQAIVRDVAMREQAAVIQREVGRLLEDVGRLNERMASLKKHFDQANGDLGLLQTTTDKISSKAQKIESLELDEPKALAPKPRLVK